MAFLTIVAIYSLTVLIFVTSIFLVAQLLRDNSIIDAFYGPIFAASATVTVLIAKIPLGWPLVLALGALWVWALRLGIRIGRKKFSGKEDARYAIWRQEWQEKGEVYFILRSYIQINLLQGIIIVIVSLPILILLTNPSAIASTSIFMIIGALVWLTGFLIESIADWQLDKFIKRKRSGLESTNLMTSGLFRYSRRPNYFGESLIWLGFAVYTLGLPAGYLALVSPALITFITARITGPILEDIFLKNHPAEYGAYQARTSYFIPWFPKNDPNKQQSRRGTSS